MMFRWMGFALVMSSLTGFALAREDIAGYPEDVHGFEQVKDAEFAETWVVPGVDFSRYKNLYVGETYYEFRDVGPARQPDSGELSDPGPGVFGISDANRQKFGEIVDEAFLKELGDGTRFTLSDHIDEDTLIMRRGVVDIVSRTPPETVGITEVYLATLGEATLEIELVDGISGEVLAKISERGRIGSPTEHIDAFTFPANRATVWYQVRRWATNSARRLRDELDSALGGDADWLD